MTHDLERLPQQPSKIFKHLLIFAVARLAALGDQEAVDYIVANLPPKERPNV